MTRFDARLADIMREARYRHDVVEAAQLADVMWLERELRELDLPPGKRELWEARVDVLKGKVQCGVGRLQDLLQAPPIIGSESELTSFEKHIREADRHIGSLWVDIETEVLALALECPRILSRGESHPPGLGDLSKTLRAAVSLCQALGRDPEQGPLDLAAGLGDFARRSVESSASLEEASHAAAMEVALLRVTLAAQERVFKSRLGRALVTLAQTLLSLGDVSEAAAAAADACGVMHPNDVPEAVRGLADLHS